MTRKEAISHIKYSIKAYQNLIENDARSGEAIGKDIKGEWKSEKTLADTYMKMIESLKMAIKALEQEPRWIPVNERLPEDHKDVLTYLSTDRITILRYNSHKLPISNNPIGWGYVPDTGFIDFEKENVIAWMPLPKKYEAESEE